MTVNSTKLSSSIPIVSNTCFLPPLTKNQIELLINLKTYNWRISITYSNDNKAKKITQITTKGTLASANNFFFEKPNKLTVLSLIRKGMLVLENESFNNDYYVRVYQANGEIEV